MLNKQIKIFFLWGGLTFFFGTIIGGYIGLYSSHVSVMSNYYGASVRLLAIKEKLDEDKEKAALLIINKSLEKEINLISFVNDAPIVLTKKQKEELVYLTNKINNKKVN